MLRILHLEPECYPDDALARLRTAGTLEVTAGCDRTGVMERLRAVRYHAIFVRLGFEVDREVLDAQPELRWVVTPTTGTNHIDHHEVERRGIRVVSLRGEREFLDSVPSTAEHTWALLLALVRRIPSLCEEVRAGAWRREGRMATELHGATLGIIGYGRLGRMVARYGQAFGMRVIAHDRDPAVEAAATAGGVDMTRLDPLLAASDVVSLHLTGGEENRGFVNAERLSRMKPGALLVNTARGEVVEEGALLASLRAGHLGGAALDVLANDSGWPERVPDRHPLVEYARDHGNLLITPHTGGYGSMSIRRTRVFVTERFLEQLAAADQPLPRPSNR